MERCPHCGEALNGSEDAFCPECRCALYDPPDQPVTPQEQQRRRGKQKFLLWQLLGGLTLAGGVVVLLTGGGIIKGVVFISAGLLGLGEGLRRARGEP